MKPIKIVNMTGLDLPKCAYVGDAGMDLRANIWETIILAPMETIVIPTGIKIQLERGWEAQVRARSGLAAKHSIGLVNGVGTIDSNFRNEIGVILINWGKDNFYIQRGDRIAQLVVTKYEEVTWEEVDKLDVSNRDLNGMGSSGIK